MNEINKSFYPKDMFEFIHHPKYISNVEVQNGSNVKIQLVWIG
jgi:hypothetical protein